MKHIHLKDLSVGYDSQIVVDKINISFMQGKMTCILGPNGSGKTTVLKTIANIISQISGVVEISGTQLDGFKSGELAREMSVVLTDRMDLPGMTGFDVAAMGRYPYTGFFGILSKKDIQHVEGCLERCGAPSLKHKYFHQLSDGEKQKILIARGLAQEPNIILLDEPTSHLDIKHKLDVLTTLKSLSVKDGKTVICTLHEPELAIKCCDYLVLVKDDRILACGPTDDVVAEGKLDELYGFSGQLFDCKTGLIEFQSVQSKDVFVIGSDDDTAMLFRRFNRQKIGFGAGVLHKNDVCYHIARTMNAPTVAIEAYTTISNDSIDLAFQMAMEYTHILASRTPNCDINLGNRLLANRLISAGKAVSFSLTENAG